MRLLFASEHGGHAPFGVAEHRGARLMADANRMQGLLRQALTPAAIPEELGDHRRKPAQCVGAAQTESLGECARLARRLEAEERFVELCFVGEGAVQQFVDAAALRAVPFVVV